MAPNVHGSTERKKEQAMLRGVATVNFFADDLEAAKDWYTEVLGVEAYFERPGYVEFRFGDHQTELGIIDARYRPPALAAGPGGAVLNWAVDDLRASLDRLIELGAEELQPITEFGPGFVTASVVDPFGNVLAIMHNVHYLEMAG
jgi:predicted enzyme related to lactoylglutathione lyase